MDWFLYDIGLGRERVKHVKVEEHIEKMCQKLSKNLLVVKFHPAMVYLHIFFSIFNLVKTCKQ